MRPLRVILMCMMTLGLLGPQAAGAAVPPPPWQPLPGTSWQWQLSGTVDQSVDAEVIVCHPVFCTFTHVRGSRDARISPFGGHRPTRSGHGTDASPTAAAPACFGKSATLSGRGRLIGTPRDDVIVGSNGADLIKGKGGDDLICSRGGADTVYSGSSRDQVRAGRGSDYVLDSKGNSDRLWGGAGSDSISIRGGVESSLFAQDELFGDKGNDVLRGGFSDDTIRGGRGDDLIDGRMDHDELFGGPGQDVIRGGPYVDTFYLTGDGDIVDGESPPSSDWVSYEHAKGPIEVDLVAASGGLAGDPQDTINGVTSVTGSPFGDSIKGDSRGNVVDGLEGNDSIEGRAGRDWLRAQVGNDTLDGGDGRDILDGNAGTDTCLNGENNQSCEVVGP